MSSQNAPKNVANIDALLWDVAQRYRQEVLAAYKRHDLMGASVLLVEALAQGVNTPTALARQLDWPPPHVSLTVNRLAERKLVARIRNPRDARSVHIVLTPEGREVVEAAKAARSAGLVEVLADFDASDRQCLQENLLCLADALTTSRSATKEA